jgi:hypothetical protein
MIRMRNAECGTRNVSPFRILHSEFRIPNSL